MIYDDSGNLVKNTTYNITIIAPSSSDIDGVHGTENQEQKLNYIILLLLFFSFLILIILFIFIKRVYLNYNKFVFSHNKKIKHFNKPHIFSITPTPKKRHSKKQDFNYNYDLNTKNFKAINFNISQSSHKGHPQEYDIGIRKQIDDLLSKFYNKK